MDVGTSKFVTLTQERTIHMPSPTSYQSQTIANDNGLLSPLLQSFFNPNRVV